MYSINIKLDSYIKQVISTLNSFLIMKNSIVCIPLLVACLLGSLSAAIPQLINYQGLLLDDNGTKVTGIKAITLKVFTGATDGNGTKEIYDENVGNVSITDGLYAFNFGGTGLSVITTTETVGSGDGSQQIYNYTVLHPPVLADSATIVKSDVNASALATWSQTGGSDDPSFISSVVNSSGAVSVTNASGAPAPGEEVKITYDYNSVGIMGALASNPNAWLEVSVDGSPLLPRQRLVAVPFANVAGTIQGENLSVDPVSGIVKIKKGIQIGDGITIKNTSSSLPLPQGFEGEDVFWVWNGNANPSDYYTVPAGKTLYITSTSNIILLQLGGTFSTSYRTATSTSTTGIYPSGSVIRTYSANNSFCGFLMNNNSSITPIAMPYTAAYTVPAGKKLIVTSHSGGTMIFSDDTYSGLSAPDPSYGRTITFKSGTIVNNNSYGWTGYLKDE